MEKLEVKEVVREVIEEVNRENLEKEFLKLKNKIPKHKKAMKFLIYAFLMPSIYAEIKVILNNNFFNPTHQIFPMMFLFFSVIALLQYRFVSFYCNRFINKPLDTITLEEIKSMKRLLSI